MYVWVSEQFGLLSERILVVKTSTYVGRTFGFRTWFNQLVVSYHDNAALSVDPNDRSHHGNKWKLLFSIGDGGLCLCSKRDAEVDCF